MLWHLECDTFAAASANGRTDAAVRVIKESAALVALPHVLFQVPGLLSREVGSTVRKYVMPLKRGRLRESCCFCHRRKVRCDRSEREAAGRPSCSACSLRGQPCKLEREETSQRPRSVRSSGGVPRPLADAPETAISDMPVTPRSPLRPSPQAPTEAAAAPREPGSRSLVNYAPFSGAVPDDTFFLSMPGAAYLDDVFLGESFGAQWQELINAADPCAEDMSLAQIEYAAESSEPQGYSTQTEMLAEPSYHKVPTASTYAQSIEVAIRAYFEHVAPVLPVVPEEAFWIDYRKGVCCNSLTLALACRGYPFLRIDNKWHIQQVVARDFRHSFLQRQEDFAGPSAIRIDELEGLALMVNFAYEESYQDPAEPRFGHLFLSSDSLVLFTLQLQQALVPEELHVPTVKLASLRERYTMLFWHVFGLDAFHCLEHLRPSRIQDSCIDDAPELPAMSTRGYLDAILGLSVVARAIVKILRSDRAGKKMTPSCLSELYGRLQAWREHLGSGQLTWNQQAATDDMIPAGGDKLAELHRFTLGMLELNCYMQIERYALRGSQHETATRSGLEHEIMERKIELESLQAIHKAFQNPHWTKIIADIRLEGTSEPSPVDRYPQILRNICAGVCTWLQSRQNAFCPATEIQPNGVRAGYVGLQVRTAESRGRYTEICQDLCTAVASAKSHHDTAQILADLSFGSDP
jgi:hypothetical protein